MNLQVQINKAGAIFTTTDGISTMASPETALSLATAIIEHVGEPKKERDIVAEIFDNIEKYVYMNSGEIYVDWDAVRKIKP